MWEVIVMNYICAVIAPCLMACTHKWVSLWCQAFSNNGQVSAEWSRSAGLMVQHARDSVAPLPRSSAGWMLASIGRLPV